MGFKKLRGVALPYEKQGQIYFTCVNYKTAPIYTQKKIDRLCESVGGEYAPALFELITSGKKIPNIAMNHYMSEEVLSRLRREFYKRY